MVQVQTRAEPRIYCIADIVGYTSLSSNLRPKVVLEMLHTYFTRLDALLDRTGAFKYQTVSAALRIWACATDTARHRESCDPVSFL